MTQKGKINTGNWGGSQKRRILIERKRKGTFEKLWVLKIIIIIKKQWDSRVFDAIKIIYCYLKAQVYETIIAPFIHSSIRNNLNQLFFKST